MVFTPIEACNIDLNYNSDYDVFSEHMFRVYSNIEISDCPSGAQVFKELISEMVRNYEICLLSFHFNSTSKYESHFYRVPYNVAWDVFR
jgi:hypothetical protein